MNKEKILISQFENGHDLFIYLVGALDTRGMFYLLETVRTDRRYKEEDKDIPKLRWITNFSFMTVRKDVCETLKDFFGGNVVISRKKKKFDHHDTWIWRVMGNELDKFCNEFHPFFFFLSEECRLMMKFRKSYVRSRTSKVTKEEEEYRSSIAKEFKYLTHEHRHANKSL